MTDTTAKRGDVRWISATTTNDNPRLGARLRADGRESLFLEYYLGYRSVESSVTGKDYKKTQRRRESLNLYLWAFPRTTEERRQNARVLELAKRLRDDRAGEVVAQGRGYNIFSERDIDVVGWMGRYAQHYVKADVRTLKASLNAFRDFLTRHRKPRVETVAQRDQRREMAVLPAADLSVQMCRDFADYLKSTHKGEGAHTYFARWKKMIIAMKDAGALTTNPAEKVKMRVDASTIRKDILTLEEIHRLASSHNERENTEVRRAFLFCCYTGLRFADVKELTYANVDRSMMRLRFEQCKVVGQSSASGVSLPLNEGHLALIGEGKPKEKIFKLPSHTMCLKSLQRWVKRAGIDKHITWHCARHSFAVNVLIGGTDIRTLASLLGHAGLDVVEKYTRVIDSRKTDAMNSLRMPEVM